ncbi:MAG: AmmeMemoRadiSam system radical SAM enzyme [Candidatus Latescibacterota bacterium]
MDKDRPMHQAMLYESLENKRVHCFLCSHHCRIAPSNYGICGVRRNEDGMLYTMVYGSVIASHVDPIEKKPLYHFLPGTRSYSIATVGCNFKCSFCQNWTISQASTKDGSLEGYEMTPGSIVSEALKNRCRSISYTYTEPTIFFEYAYDTAKLAREAGLFNIFVTNGYMTGEALDVITPYLDAANVDLKSFRDEYYRTMCKARLQPVLDTIVRMKEKNIWVEVTTLIVPGENDSEDELNATAKFLSDVSIDIPWHISRFFPNYTLSDHSATPLKTLLKAREIGKKHGIRFIYIGNVDGYGDTRCYTCDTLLVKRAFMTAQKNHLTDTVCPDCGAEIKGIWK